MAVVEIHVSSDRWICTGCGRRYRIPGTIDTAIICTCGGREFVQRTKMVVLS